VEAGRVIEALGHALDQDGDALLPEGEISLLREAIVKLESLVEGDDHEAISEGTDMLGKASEEFAALRMDAAVRRALAGRQLEEFDE